jgi:selenocysteine-specific elongation factor
VIVATAGHVDHGKTALIKRLTGVDTDRLAEEKARGLSIDLGFAFLPLEGKDVLGFVDVPGHERFIANMLAGVGAIDYAMLIVAADDGIMPQTDEHIAILDLLQIPAGVVVVTKTDRVSTERVAAVERQITERLRTTVLDGASVLAVSSVTGQGIDALLAHLRDAARTRRSSRDTGNFRLAVDRRFTVAGVGLVVTGAVFSGSVAVGDRLMLSPHGLPVRVRGIHAQNAPAKTGVAGQRLALNLAGADIEKDTVRRGDWIVAPAIHAPVSRIDARVHVLASPATALRSGQTIRLHLGAADVSARVAVLEDRSKGRAIEAGESGLVQLVLSRPTSAVRGDRFVLRDSSCRRTIAGGAVIDPFGPARGRSRATRIQQLNALEHPNSQVAFETLLELCPDGVDLTWFGRVMNFTEAQARSLGDQSPHVRVNVGSRCLAIAREHWSRLCQQITACVGAFHEREPRNLGPSAPAVHAALGHWIDPAIVNAALADLVSSGKLGTEGQSYFQPSHRATVRDTKDDLGARILPILAESGVPPATVNDIAAQLQISQQHILAYLNRAAAKGIVRRVSNNRFYLPETLVRLARDAAAVSAAKKDGWFRVTDFRDHTGIGRNPSIEVLEFFDKTGVTRRTGDDRRVIPAAVDSFAAGKIVYRR